MKRNILSERKIVSDMTKHQLSRWLSLFEAVNIIAEGAEESGVKFNNLSIKKNALDDYIKHTSDIIYRDLNNTVQRVS